MVPSTKQSQKFQTKIATHNMYSANQLQSIIYEDNATCLSIANDTKALTGPQTHHLLLKWHHVKDQIISGSI